MSIGGNDFYPSLSMAADVLRGDDTWMPPRFDALRKNFDGAIDEIRRLNPKARLIVQSLYNSALPLPMLYDTFDAAVTGINGIIRDYLKDHPKAYQIADVYAAFQGKSGLVSLDMIHPSTRGHAVIADTLLDTLGGSR